MTTDPAARPAGRLALGFMIVGVVLTLVGPILDTVGGLGAITTPGLSALIALGVIVQAAGAAFLLGALIGAVVALVRGARPIARPMVAILGIPIAGVLLLLELVVLFLVTP